MGATKGALKCGRGRDSRRGADAPRLRQGRRRRGGRTGAGRAPVGGARRGAAADLVLRNGRVHTLAGARQQAVAITDGGSPRRLQRRRRHARRRRRGDRAGGRMVMPGIHDGHMHLLSGGLVLTAPTLNYRQLNLKEFVAAIRKLLVGARAKRSPTAGFRSTSGTRPRWTSCRPRRISTSSRRRGRSSSSRSTDTSHSPTRGRSRSAASARARRTRPGARSAAGRTASRPGSCSTTRSASSPTRSRR